MAQTKLTDKQIVTSVGTASRTLDEKLGDQYNIRDFGAVCDGVTDDRAAFLAADAAGFSPVIIDADTRISSALGEANSNIVYELRNGATVTQDVGTWFPRERREVGEGGIQTTKTQFASADPSPTITGAEYPIIQEAPAFYARTVNFWGAQAPAPNINSNSYGRTGIDSLYLTAAHYGEGDYYLMRTNGTAYAHGRVAEVSAVRGQNNIGMFNGQLNAGTGQVTLYGFGDIVLDDKGYDNVALRGMNFFLYADGTDAHGYTVDRFGIRMDSQGTNDCDGAFISTGNWRVSLDTTIATNSSGTAIALADGQKISFNCSGAATDNGYTSTSFGTFYIQTPATVDRVEIGASGSTMSVYSNRVEYTPSTPDSGRVRIKASGTAYADMQAATTTAYFGCLSSSTDNTNVALRNALAGVTQNALTITSAGVADFPIAGSKIRLGGTQVVQSRITGWAAATGSATRTTFATTTVTTEQLAERVKALIDDLTTHGLIGA